MSSAKTFKIQMSFVATISTQQITNTTSEQGPEKHEGLKVLDTILRQHAAKQYVHDWLGDSLFLLHHFHLN